MVIYGYKLIILFFDDDNRRTAVTFHGVTCLDIPRIYGQRSFFSDEGSTIVFFCEK